MTADTPQVLPTVLVPTMAVGVIRPTLMSLADRRGDEELTNQLDTLRSYVNRPVSGALAAAFTATAR